MRTHPQIMTEKKAPPGSCVAPHYYLPTQIFTLRAIPGPSIIYVSEGKVEKI
jgi:hypothetical protein